MEESLREEIVNHILDSGCEVLTENNKKHTIYVNMVDRSLKSALVRNEYLSDKYVINVCKCLGISIPVLIEIRNSK
jgi:hypothetical protein